VTWEAFIIGWVLLFFAPKFAVIPVFRWMWRAMKDSEARDVVDAAWLATWEASRRDGGEPIVSPSRRWPGPLRPDGTGRARDGGQPGRKRAARPVRSGR
jgi:hypothetical protein